jgi:hypothetical protein
LRGFTTAHRTCGASPVAQDVVCGAGPDRAFGVPRRQPPVGHEQLRVLEEAARLLPAGVTKLSLRSDTAAYQQDLLKYCAEGKNERFGVIEFAVGADVTGFEQADPLAARALG